MSVNILDLNSVVKKKRIIPYPLPEGEFRWLFIASSGSGKTNVITNLLSRFYFKRNGESYWDHIFIFAPTAETDPLFEILYKHEKLNKIIQYNSNWDENEEIIEGLLDTFNPNEKTLVYFDDFANDKKALSSPTIKRLFFSGRHRGVSCIISAQDYFSVPRDLRTNCTHYCVFNLRKRDFNLVKKDLETPGFEGEGFDIMFTQATQEKYSFLFIDWIEKRYYRKFEEEFITLKNTDQEIKYEKQLKENGIVLKEL